MPSNTASRHPSLRFVLSTLLVTLSSLASTAFVSSMSKIAVVTGANKGIGLAIAKKLALTPGHVCVLTSRDTGRGEEAIQGLKKEGGIKDSLVFKQLDLGDPASVERFANEIEAEYGRCDILVNNAGRAFKAADPTPFQEQAEPTLKTNFFDTMAFTEKMLPLVRKSEDGRVVIVASSSGHLSILRSNALKQEFTSPSLTKERLSELMSNFVQDVKGGRHQAGGWPNTTYGMSKLGIIAYTKVLAKAEQDAGTGVTANACCPGYVDTDMTSHQGYLTTEEGARTPYMLTQMKGVKEGGITGGFFKEEAGAHW